MTRECSRGGSQRLTTCGRPPPSASAGGEALSCRGKHTGAAAPGPRLRSADATAARLEATPRRAAAFCGRHGFVDDGVLDSEDRLPEYWAMTRPKRRRH